MLRRLREIVYRSRWESDLSEEIRFHLESLESEFRSKGLSEREARMAARREFGAVEAMKEQYRDRRGLPWLETLWHDIRYGARLLARAPGFSAAAVLTLALGLGANSAMFTLVHAVLLRMAPVTDPEQVALVRKTGPEYLQGSTYRFYRQVRERGDLFQSVAATGREERGRVQTPSGEDTSQIWTEAVSSTYFQTLGVGASVGRLLTDADETAPGANPVAVISYDYWRSQFGGDAGVLGRPIAVREKPLTVIGVAAPGFRGLDPRVPVDVWCPLTMVPHSQWLTHDTASWLTLLVRLTPATTPDIARSALDVAWQSYITAVLQGQRHPWKADLLAQKIVVQPGALGIPALRERFQKPLAVLMGIVLLVLAITCANVGNLLIARGAARARELSLRVALGASRGRLVRQLFTESLLLAAAGAAAGLLLAFLLNRYLVRFLPLVEGTLPLDMNPDSRILAFTTGVAFVAALLFGLLPAWHVLRDKPVKLVSRRVLVAAQVALSMVVIAGAGLFIRTLAGLRAVDAGFQREEVTTFWLDVPATYSQADSTGLVSRLVDRLSAAPGVTSISCATPGPFRAGKASRTILVHGQPAEDAQPVDIQSVTPSYFTTLGVRLLAGRYLQQADTVRPLHALLVNEAFVRQYFAGTSEALKSRVGLNTEKDGGPFVPIVGVVRDVLHQGLRERPLPEVILPLGSGEPSAGLSFQVRGSAGVEQIRRVIGQVDKSVILVGARPLAEQVDESLSQERLLAALCGWFALLSLTLAAVGLYGVVAYSVSRRTREIGIRVAIGARRSELLWMVLRDALGMMGAGIAVGLPAAFLTPRFVASLLYGVVPGDPMTMVAATLILVLAGVVAALIPARRAASIEPSAALRYE